MRTRWVAAVLAALVVGGCGGGTARHASSALKATASGAGGSKPPDQALADAVGGLGRQTSGTVTVKLFGSAADFGALMAETGGTPASARRRATADKVIPSSSLTMSFEKTSTHAGTKAEIALNLPHGTKAFDLVVLHRIVYLRVDVGAIASATGADTSKLDAEASAASAELPFVGDLMAGRWVSLDLAGMSGLARSLGAGATTTTGPPGVAGRSPEQKVIAIIRSVLTQDTTITRVGSDDVGTHYRIAVNPRQAAQSIYGQLSILAGRAAPALGKLGGRDLGHIPDKPVAVDAWVSGGRLERIRVDLRQFHQAPGGPTRAVGVEIDFGRQSGSISAPLEATPVDLSKVKALLDGLGGLGGLGRLGGLGGLGVPGPTTVP